MFIIAISAGKIARNPKNATPPPMIGMLSALFSAQARWTICFQPRHGISVGLSAVTPGSCSSLGAPDGSRSACGCGPRASAALAAARRAAFSSTRSRMRSTALSRFRVPATSVARPAAGQLGEAARARAVDGRLGGGEDRALQGRGEHDLAHPVLALQGVGCVVLVRHALPDLLEDGARDHTGQDAAEQADRPVDEFGSLAAHLVLLTARRAFAAFFAVLFVVFLAALRAVLRAAFSAAARRAAGTLAARFAPRAATPRSFLRGRPTRRASRATTPAPAATKVGRRTALS